MTDEWFGEAQKAMKKEMDEDDGERYDAWKPDEGAILQGTLVQRKILPTATDKGYSRMIVVEEEGVSDDEGNPQRWTVWCSSKALEDAIVEYAPAIGSLIAIQFHGKVPLKSDPSRSFNRYTMRVQEEDHAGWQDMWTRFHHRREAKIAEANEAPPGPVVATPSGVPPEESPF